ncbi:MAG TPA: hypothetical protein VF834_25345 [Streptosporangiaceae bacterium]
MIRNPVLPVGSLWVANGGNDSVTEISTGGLIGTDGAFVQNILGPQYGFDHPFGIIASRTQIWVTNPRANSVSEFNASDGSWIRTVTGGSYGLFNPGEMLLTPAGVWVTNGGTPSANSIAILPTG